MKEGIHPNYSEATITCACGNVFTTNSITFKGEDDAIAKGIFAFCNCSNKGQMPSIGLRLWSTIYFLKKFI